MDITNSVQSKQSSTLARSSSAKATEAEAVESQRNIPSSDRDGDKDNSQAIDTATISAEAYNIAATSTVSGVTNETRIPDEQKAKELASDIVSMAKSNPADLQKTASNVSEAGVLRLLAA
jgi:hypothetical protein